MARKKKRNKGGIRTFTSGNETKKTSRTTLNMDRGSNVSSKESERTDTLRLGMSSLITKSLTTPSKRVTETTEKDIADDKSTEVTSAAPTTNDNLENNYDQLQTAEPSETPQKKSALAQITFRALAVMASLVYVATAIAFIIDGFSLLFNKKAPIFNAIKSLYGHGDMTRPVSEHKGEKRNNTVETVIVNSDNDELKKGETLIVDYSNNSQQIPTETQKETPNIRSNGR